MAMWLYQMSQTEWGPEQYRLEIWENERWRWPVNRISSKDRPAPGDSVVFFYAPSGGKQAGFYGWAVILQWEDTDDGFYFRPVPPSDQLKMHPWWDGKGGVAETLAKEVRGKVAQGTLWPVSDETASKIGTGINQWIAGAALR